MHFNGQVEVMATLTMTIHQITSKCYHSKPNITQKDHNDCQFDAGARTWCNLQQQGKGGKELEGDSLVIPLISRYKAHACMSNVHRQRLRGGLQLVLYLSRYKVHAHTC